MYTLSGWLVGELVAGWLVLGGQPAPLDFARLLAPKVAGERWQPTSEVQIYDRETLYHYLNGGAEFYLAYDFQRLGQREFRQATGSNLVVELYEMASSADAYGVFSSDPTGEKVSVGTAGVYGYGLLKFWQGRLFARLLALDAPEGVKPDLLTFGQRLAALVPPGPRPALVEALSPRGLVPDSERFFHTQRSLNSFYYLSEANLLHLSRETQAVLADYREGQQRTKVLVVDYPHPRTAQAALRDFARHYLRVPLPAGQKTAATRLENGRYAGGRQVSPRRLLFILESTAPLSWERPYLRRTEKPKR
ncbi:MAG TPA: hypothetical protein EYP85_07550 [Armatimonadetes bacterium]|nr:hypothetical protein [Armatimonadota bacterium]